MAMVLIASVTGFFAGCLHAFSGPDHIAAIAPLSADSDRDSWKVGFRWGLGHSLGTILIGLAALILRDVVNMEIINLVAEIAVGVTLIGIGLWGLGKLFPFNVHSHGHIHDHLNHDHVHTHFLEKKFGKTGTHIHTHAALAVGILHGFAGGSYILGIIPALAMPSTLTSVIYLFFFSVGTIVAMAGFASLFGNIVNNFLGGGEAVYRKIMGGSSILAILVGAVWLVA